MILCKSPLATLNPLQIALLSPQHCVCAYFVSIGSILRWRQAVYRNVFVINHKVAFKIRVQCGCRYFFSLKNLKCTQLDCWWLSSKSHHILSSWLTFQTILVLVSYHNHQNINNIFSLYIMEHKQTETHRLPAEVGANIRSAATDSFDPLGKASGSR